MSSSRPGIESIERVSARYPHPVKGQHTVQAGGPHLRGMSWEDFVFGWVPCSTRGWIITRVRVVFVLGLRSEFNNSETSEGARSLEIVDDA